MQSLGSFNYWIVIILMMLGFYAVLARGNLIKKVVGPERVVAGGPPYGDIDCCADVGSEPAEPKIKPEGSYQEGSTCRHAGRLRIFLGTSSIGGR